jgi:NAD(P)-dependent dehydrogenase (short-subunit alcohol dehydrogenase family)
VPSLVETDIARLRRIVDVNVMGALLCAREAARRLAVSRGGTGGSIVLVSSAASRLGSPHEAAADPRRSPTRSSGCSATTPPTRPAPFST